MHILKKKLKMHLVRQQRIPSGVAVMFVILTPTTYRVYKSTQWNYCYNFCHAEIWCWNQILSAWKNVILYT